MEQVHPTRAFRCKSCGHLSQAEHAGENDVPHACRVCGKGVTHTGDKNIAEAAKALGKIVLEPMPNYYKIVDNDNWEVLADCTPERLKELGIEPEHVTKHCGEEFKERQAKLVAAAATDGIGAKDKA